jgi:hypothetical protein
MKFGITRLAYRSMVVRDCETNTIWINIAPNDDMIKIFQKVNPVIRNLIAGGSGELMGDGFELIR